VAREHQTFHADRFGYANVSFQEGTIERLEELPLEAGSFDVVVSNCVLNLSTDKGAVLRGVKRLLKPGGEFYFADVYADRRLPEELRRHPVLYGECLGGALYRGDFLRLARAAGFLDPRLVTEKEIHITDAALAPLVGEARFHSATYRLFNLDQLEDACEDHGQAVIYRGTIEAHPHRYDLDGHHALETGRVFPVCGNSFHMLKDTRLAPHFSFIGDFNRHYGPFGGCGNPKPVSNDPSGGEVRSFGSCC
jgi:arsenite methyltransferase